MGGVAPKKDITLDSGKVIAAEAATWKGTPYVLNGMASAKGVGGDCSGSTYKIYLAAKCPFDYQSAAAFRVYAPKSGLFRVLASGESKQDGDILSWPHHMAIYSSFIGDADDATTARVNKKDQKWTQYNDMWTATHPGGGPYQPAAIKYWSPDPPKVFRYQTA